MINERRFLAAGFLCLALAIICFVLIVMGGCSLKQLQVGHASLQGADVGLTYYTESRGAVEANPFFRGSFAQRIVLKSLGTASVIYISHQIAKAGRQKLARGLLYAVNGLLTGVVVNNFAVARSQR